MKWEWTAAKSKSFEETHLWSDGFSRDSGLRGAGKKVNGMQCKRKRPEGKKKGGECVCVFRPGAVKSITYQLLLQHRPCQGSITTLV